MPRLHTVSLSNPVNRQHPLNKGLQAWWLCLPHLMGGRQWFDLMGLYPATLTTMNDSARGWKPSTRPGGIGQLKCNAVAGAGASAGDVLNNATNNLTVAGWAYLTSTSANFQAIAVKGTTGRNYVLALNAGALNSVFTVGITFANQPTISITLALNTWYHVVAVRDVGGDGGVIYINGKSVYSDAGTTRAANAENLVLGSGGGGFAPVSGGIDDVRIYNRSLKAREVMALYNASRAGYPGVLNRMDDMLWTPGAAFKAAWARNANTIIQRIP